MKSDSLASEDSPKSLLVREVVNILNQTIDKIDDNDLFSAEIMVGVALQYLENLQTDLNQHLSLEKMLREMVNPS